MSVVTEYVKVDPLSPDPGVMARAASVIAAGAVVLREVPDNCTAVGVPAHVVRLQGRPVFFADDVDQISVEDPVMLELRELRSRVRRLEEKEHLQNEKPDFYLERIDEYDLPEYII